MKALLLIDIQKGLTARPLYEKEKFFDNVNKAMLYYRQNNNLVVFVQHESKQLTAGTKDWEIDNRLHRKPTDAVFPKQKGDAFSSSDLVSYLKDNKVTDIAIGGLVTHGCIKHTCLGGVKAGFSMSLIQNGHTSWAKDAKDKIDVTETFLKEAGIIIIKI